MSEHTNEPWNYGGTPASTKEDLIRIFSESIDAHVGDIGRYFMEIYSEDGKRIAFLAGPTSHENARRIVVCVNACTGIPTEQLDGVSVYERQQSFRRDYQEMKQQRDELLAALKSLNYTASENSPNAKIVRVAIAKAEGK